jgi:hypothetical protein
MSHRVRTLSRESPNTALQTDERARAGRGGFTKAGANSGGLS